MQKNYQNLVVLMEPSYDAENTSLRGGNMCLNRFCIDEDAAFELSQVRSFEKSSKNFFYYDKDSARESKGKGF